MKHENQSTSGTTVKIGRKRHEREKGLKGLRDGCKQWWSKEEGTEQGWSWKLHEKGQVYLRKWWNRKMQQLKKNRSSRKEDEWEKPEIFRIPTVYNEVRFGLREFVFEHETCSQGAAASSLQTNQSGDRRTRRSGTCCQRYPRTHYDGATRKAQALRYI